MVVILLHGLDELFEESALVHRVALLGRHRAVQQQTVVPGA